MNKDRSDQETNWLCHFGPEDRTAHQKDRSAQAPWQTDIGGRMHVHRWRYSDAAYSDWLVTISKDNVTFGADA